MKKKPTAKFGRKDTINLVSIELLKRGFWVSINSLNPRESNIQCMDIRMKKLVNIRVVKSNISSGIWTLNENVKDYQSVNLFYVFVCYEMSGLPKFFVVPNEDVLDFTEKNAEQWLSSKKKDGTPHKNIRTRKFIIRSNEERKYRNRWNLLGLESRYFSQNTLEAKIKMQRT